MKRDDLITIALVEAHKFISNSIRHAVESLPTPEILFPNDKFTDEESEALKSLQLSPASKSGLCKLFIDAGTDAFHDLFALLDGVTDPEITGIKHWPGLSLGKKRENEDMLHDQFFDAYAKYDNWASQLSKKNSRNR